jgi:hypothetical protein
MILNKNVEVCERPMRKSDLSAVMTVVGGNIHGVPIGCGPPCEIDLKEYFQKASVDLVSNNFAIEISIGFSFITHFQFPSVC